ncbi:hypothetical protein [Nocardioides sp. HB32]
MLRRIGATFAVLLMTAGVGLVVTAPADAAHAGLEARSVLPYHGHYLGRDGHDRSVRFYFDGHSLSNVTVNGHLIVSSAPVSGATVHHRCDSHTRKCVRGHWASDTEFFGIWNDPNQGHESHFTAYVYAH